MDFSLVKKTALHIGIQRCSTKGCNRYAKRIAVQSVTFMLLNQLI
jgi:hypothetical protein